jgi:sialic acid synthase SpsE
MTDKVFDQISDVKCPPLVIAEVGINHGGCLATAKKMADLVVASGGRCIKHQTHVVEDEMTCHAKSIKPPNASISIWEVIENNSLSLDDELEFKEYSESLGLTWISTPFSRAAVDFLCEINVPFFKVGSGECDNLPLLSYIASKGKPVIMSTGMNTIEGLKPSVDIFTRASIKLVLLECTNAYPSPPELVSLRGILDLKHSFPNIPIGFSDHSIGPTIALAATALGARVIERHFTMSRYSMGPDIACSMDAAELRYLIDRSKEIAIAIQNPKNRTDTEQEVYRFARGSVVADRDLEPGTRIGRSDIWVRRPGTGEIAPSEFERCIDRIVKNPLRKNDQIRWADLEPFGDAGIHVEGGD